MDRPESCPKVFLISAAPSSAPSLAPLQTAAAPQSSEYANPLLHSAKLQQGQSCLPPLPHLRRTWVPELNALRTFRPSLVDRAEDHHFSINGKRDEGFGTCPLEFRRKILIPNVAKVGRGRQGRRTCVVRAVGSLIWYRITYTRIQSVRSTYCVRSSRLLGPYEGLRTTPGQCAEKNGPSTCGVKITLWVAGATE